MLTYDVKIWGIRQRGNVYQLRWRVGTTPHAKTFKVKAAAEGRRAELLIALRDGEQFDTETGLPRSEMRAIQSPTWFAHACDYAAMKWPNISAKHRASIADALATITPKLVKDLRGMPAPQVLRRALYSWTFQFGRNRDGELKPRSELAETPEEIRAALDWIAKKSILVSDLNTPMWVRTALYALALKMDGSRAAENTIHRKHTVFSNALRYAVERELLTTLPLGKVDWQAPETADEVDFRYVPSPRLARRLIASVARQSDRGAHLRAFFGCLYYAAMRPSEARDLKLADAKLPEKGWGELILASSAASVGSGWTDSGNAFDSRGLKKRARKTTRPVPIPPVLVRMLRAHLDEYGTAADGRVFQASGGGPLLSKEYPEVWQKARTAVLTEEEAATPLAKVPYSLRHAGVSLWLSSGVPPAEVARRAGHSIAVLYRFYAKAIHGHQEHANQQIEQGLKGGYEEEG